MTNQKAAFIKDLWKRLTGREFVSLDFVEQIRRQGGIDTANLSHEDLLKLLEGRFAGDWNEVSFSFSELLASYSVPNSIRELSRTKEEVVGWAFATFIIADAIKHDITSWEMQFDKFMNGFLDLRKELETEECVQVFQQAFSNDGNE